MRRWIFSALGVLAVCLLMTGLDARAADLQAVRVSFSQAWLVSEGQEFALEIR
jgi:hypothetical protein